MSETAPAPPPVAVAPKRAWAGRLALLAFSTLFSLAAVELAYRAITRRRASGAPDDDGGWYERTSRMNRTIYRRSDDPALVYEPVPGSSVEMHYGAAGFNRASLRDDREPAPAPDPARPRVALLGDSIVWGEELALHDTLAARAREALDRRHASYEVLNAGVTGYDTAQEARWYRRAVRPLRPAAVVLVYCLNDAMIMSGPFNRFATPAESARKEAQEALFERLAPMRAETLDSIADRQESAALFRSLAHARSLLRSATYARRRDYVDEYLLSHRQPDAAPRVRESLAQLAADVRADGARPLLVISPMLSDWDSYPWAELHALVRSAGERAGFTVVDPLPAWRAQRRDPRSMRLPGDRLHYGESGTRALAEFIADAVATGGAPGASAGPSAQR